MMTFQQLKVEPWFVHRLAGDVIWVACWADRAAKITSEHVVPQKLMNIVTHVVATMDQQLKDKATEELRTEAAKTIAEQREAQKRRRTQ